MDFTTNFFQPPTNSLSPVIPNYARSFVLPRLLATKLAGPSYSGTVIFFPDEELYNPRAFFTHAASLHQSFLHCARFPTAASRRSLGRVSVPMWLIILSNQLLITVLVGHYPTNKLIRQAHPMVHKAFSVRLIRY